MVNQKNITNIVRGLKNRVSVTAGSQSLYYLLINTASKTIVISIVSVKDKILFRAFKIAIIVALAREVCGAIPVLNFAGDIFATASKGTNFVLTPNQQAMMLGLIQVTGSMLGSSVVEKAGRKVRDDISNNIKHTQHKI